MPNETMTAPASLAGARTLRDLELQIGVDPIDVLQADRRAVVEDLAPLRAKYGPGGTWDARRKAHRSAIATEIASKLQEERGKAPSEAEVERLAAGDPRVQARLDEAEAEMARYAVLEDECQRYTELLNRGQALIRYVTSEPK